MDYQNYNENSFEKNCEILFVLEVLCLVRILSEFDFVENTFSSTILLCTKLYQFFGTK